MDTIASVEALPSWQEAIRVFAEERSHGWSERHNMLLSFAAWLCVGIAMGSLFMGLGLRQYRADQATMDGLKTDAAIAA